MLGNAITPHFPQSSGKSAIDNAVAAAKEGCSVFEISLAMNSGRLLPEFIMYSPLNRPTNIVGRTFHQVEMLTRVLPQKSQAVYGEQGAKTVKTCQD